MCCVWVRGKFQRFQVPRRAWRDSIYVDETSMRVVVYIWVLIWIYNIYLYTYIYIFVHVSLERYVYCMSLWIYMSEHLPNHSLPEICNALVLLALSSKVMTTETWECHLRWLVGAPWQSFRSGPLKGETVRLWSKHGLEFPWNQVVKFPLSLLRFSR